MDLECIILSKLREGKTPHILPYMLFLAYTVYMFICKEL